MSGGLEPSAFDFATFEPDFDSTGLRDFLPEGCFMVVSGCLEAVAEAGSRGGLEGSSLGGYDHHT